MKLSKLCKSCKGVYILGNLAHTDPFTGIQTMAAYGGGGHLSSNFNSSSCSRLSALSVLKTRENS